MTSTLTRDVPTLVELRRTAGPGPVADRRAEGPWGRLPETGLLIAAGLFAVSLAYAGGRAGASWSEAAYWIGQLLMFVPPLVRVLTARRITEREGAGTATALGLAYFASAYCYSPLQFKFIDELQHWRTATNILETGHLFTYNNSLPISAVYPGLESVTTAVAALTGLSVFGAAVVVMCVVRVLLTTALYLLAAQLSGSARVAALASILFTTAPYYKAVLAKFIYGNFALAFLVLTLYAAARAVGARDRRHRALMVGLAVVCIYVTVTSHHLTSWFLLGALLLATLAFRFTGDRTGFRVLAGLSASCLALIVGWVLVVAPGTMVYLSPAVTDLVGGVAGRLTGSTKASDGGFVRAPLSEALPSYLAVLVISGCVVVCARWVWRRHRADAWLLTITAAALGYLVVPVIRVVSDSGSEDAVRLQSYVLVAVSFVLALVGAAWLRQTANRSRALTACAAVAVVALVGGITSGWPPFWGRIPADHMVVDGYENAVDPEGVAAAYWAQGVLPPGQRIAADDTNYTLMGPIGQQAMVRGMAAIYWFPVLRPVDRADMASERLQYVVTDRRLTEQLPAGGSYFPDDPNANRYTAPLSPAVLDKFDHIDGVGRVLDSGNIIIYDVQGLDHAP